MKFIANIFFLKSGRAGGIRTHDSFHIVENTVTYSFYIAMGTTGSDKNTRNVPVFVLTFAPKFTPIYAHAH